MAGIVYSGDTAYLPVRDYLVGKNDKCSQILQQGYGIGGKTFCKSKILDFIYLYFVLRPVCPAFCNCMCYVLYY